MATFTSKRGLQWHYDAAGSGEALVFIHGFAGSGQWWQYTKDFLCRDFKVITVDLPGHGQSQWMTVSLNDMAQDIGQLMDHLGIDHFSIVASSFGGLIAMELYRQMANHRIMRISFVGSIPKFARSENYPAGLDIDKIRTMSQQFEANYGSVLDIFFRSLFTMKERDSKQFQALKQLRVSETLPQKPALQHFLTLLEATDYRDRISKIICPLQYITGSDDYICPKAIMDWIAEHTYNARFDVIDKCGHLPFLTEVDEYNRLLEDFLLN